MEKQILNLHVKFHDFYLWNNEDTKILNFGFSKPSEPDLLIFYLKYDFSKKIIIQTSRSLKDFHFWMSVSSKNKTWTL